MIIRLFVLSFSLDFYLHFGWLVGWLPVYKSVHSIFDNNLLFHKGALDMI